MLQPRIEIAKERKLVGARLKMSVANNRTQELWGGFVPKIKKIINRLNDDKISMQVYDPMYYQNFNPNTIFEKWAVVEVADLENVPKELESFILISGEYAVFDYKGAGNDPGIFYYIFTKWLPNSEYELDNRPHFEILGEKYKNNHPDSEEQIWIPVKKKAG
ncbi:GyrI-like domain-containing protein [Aquimarina sp. 2201CG1-2-11]|uniref:GyrI-like domain-containing protein n=1 Tax=Aquimarina discodermiae TaxID=3231043 RepID=UPI0034629208